MADSPLLGSAQFDSKSRLGYDRIASYSKLSKSQQAVVNELFVGLLSCSDRSCFDGEVKISLGVEAWDAVSYDISAKTSDGGLPLFYSLAGLVPSSIAGGSSVDRLIGKSSKFFAIAGIPVLGANVMVSDALSKSLLVKCSLAATKDSSAFHHSDAYKVYVIPLSSKGAIVNELELEASLKKIRYEGLFFDTYSASNLCSIGFILRMAARLGFRLSIDLDSYKKCCAPRSLVVVATAAQSAAISDLVDVHGAVECGSIFEGTGENSFRYRNEQVAISSLILDELFLVASGVNGEASKARLVLNPTAGGVLSDAKLETLIQDSLESIDLMSGNQMSSAFNVAVNSYGFSSARSSAATYVRIKNGGRYLFSNFVFDASSEGIVAGFYRIVLEHQSYAGAPVQASIKVVVGKEHLLESFDSLNELASLLDVLGISFEVSRSVSDGVRSPLIVVALLSSLQISVGRLMDGFRKKGDVIYLVNFSTLADKQHQAASHALASIPEHLVEQLVLKGLISSLNPVSKGGLFCSLFEMASKPILGFDITSDLELSQSDFLFGDSLGRVVVSVSEESEAHFVDLMRKEGVSTTLVGHVTKGEIRIDDVSFGFIADLKKKVSFAFQNNIKKMASKKVVKPYEGSDSSKKEQVASMFDNIAPKYDFLNHFLSLGIDKLWRKRLVREVGKYKHDRILDIATGTGDLAIALAKLTPQSIVGIDIAIKMVEVGIEKVKAKNLDTVVFLQQGDSEMINYDSNTFDFATVAFGVRNFEDPLKGLREINRVVKPGGGLAVLEFAMPRKFPIKQLYKFYFFQILPFVGRLFSKDKSAYTYLPESVEAFPSGADFTRLMEEAGFKSCRIIPLTFGVANIYIGEK